jgi:hypothetical protein
MTNSNQQSADLVAGAGLFGAGGGLFGFVQVLPGFTAEAYGRVIEALGPEPLAGLVAHLAGPCGEGWRIVEVWQSAADHARFERDRLWPALAAADALTAVSRAPLVETVEVSHVLLGAGPMTISNDR